MRVVRQVKGGFGVRGQGDPAQTHGGAHRAARFGIRLGNAPPQRRRYDDVKFQGAIFKARLS